MSPPACSALGAGAAVGFNTRLRVLECNSWRVRGARRMGPAGRVAHDVVVVWRWPRPCAQLAHMPSGARKTPAGGSEPLRGVPPSIPGSAHRSAGRCPRRLRGGPSACAAAGNISRVQMAAAVMGDACAEPGPPALEGVHKACSPRDKGGRLERPPRAETAARACVGKCSVRLRSLRGTGGPCAERARVAAGGRGARLREWGLRACAACLVHRCCRDVVGRGLATEFAPRGRQYRYLGVPGSCQHLSRRCRWCAHAHDQGREGGNGEHRGAFGAGEGRRRRLAPRQRARSLPARVGRCRPGAGARAAAPRAAPRGAGAARARAGAGEHRARGAARRRAALT
jgi:hypothetical protein